MTRVLAVIPARGGSKGLPRKNLRLLGGVPLVAHAVRQALAASTVDRVVVSTDSAEIAAVARAEGAEVPFTRPAEFATDTATDLQVFAHLVEFLAETEGRLPELLVQVRASSPVRRPQVIDLAVRKMLAHPEATSLRSVSVAPFPPYKMWNLDADSRLRPVVAVPGVEDWYDQPRQALPAAYAQDGLIDVVRVRTITEDHSMAGAVVLGLTHPERAVDIDTIADLAAAEAAYASATPARVGNRPLGIVQGRLTVPWNGELQCFPRGAWAAEFRAARDLGFDAIEVIADDLDADNPLLADHTTAELARVSHESGVAVHASSVDYVMRHDLRSPATVDWVRTLAPRLAAVGARIAVLPLFGASDITDPGVALAAVPHLRAVADAMRPHDIRVGVESALPGPVLYEYLGLLAHDNIGVCYDMGNTTAFGHDTVSDLGLLAPLVWHVHVKDKDATGRNVPLGTGRARLADLFGELVHAGRDCALSLETPRGAEPGATARTHAELVRQLEAEARA